MNYKMGLVCAVLTSLLTACATMEVNTDQHRTSNSTKTKRHSRLSWNRLGPVLGHVDVDPGFNNHEMPVVLHRFCEHHI